MHTRTHAHTNTNVNDIMDTSVGQYSCRGRLTGDGLSLSLSVFLRRLVFLPVREEEEEEEEAEESFSLAAAFLAVIASALASN